MKAKYNKQIDENIAQWINRIMPDLMKEKLEDAKTIVKIISRESYFIGARNEREIHMSDE